MRKRSATKSSKNTRKGKKGKKGRGPTQARMPAGFPPGAFGPGGLGGGGLGAAGLGPGGAPNLPPGMEMPDLSKLDLPKQ